MTFDGRQPLMEDDGRRVDRQMGRHVGGQLAGRWKAGGQVGWPGRCITLPLAVRRHSFWVKAQLYKLAGRNG